MNGRQTRYKSPLNDVADFKFDNINYDWYVAETKKLFDNNRSSYSQPTKGQIIKRNQKNHVDNPGRVCARRMDGRNRRKDLGPSAPVVESIPCPAGGNQRFRRRQINEGFRPWFLKNLSNASGSALSRAFLRSNGRKIFDCHDLATQRAACRKTCAKNVEGFNRMIRAVLLIFRAVYSGSLVDRPVMPTFKVRQGGRIARPNGAFELTR